MVLLTEPIFPYISPVFRSFTPKNCNQLTTRTGRAMSVSKVERKDRDKKYGVKWTVGGKRRHRFFEKKSDRNEYFKEMVEKERREGKAALDISTVEAQIMRRCIDLLGSPEQVLMAAEEKAKSISIASVPVADAVKSFLDEKHNLGRDENWLRANRNILNRFAESFSGQSVSECERDQVQQWVLQLNFAPVTIQNHVKACGSFFNWCVSRKYCRENIFKGVAFPDVIQSEPEFLTVGQTKKLFKAAAKHYPDALAYLALQAFAGIRSSACARISMDEIKFKQRGILITAKNAKNNQRQHVDGHPDNLWEWMEYAKQVAPEGFEMSKRLWDRRKAQLQEKAKIKMPHNALRHSFCSYHVALDGDAGKTATLLTHRGNVSILYAHYKGNASKADAEKYFSIDPIYCCRKVPD